ncbi:MAG: hypothetical protein L7S55_07360 [Luminiphilus sp.]|nr:hypothetical protein [Luminiphilus sp.]
MRHLLACLAILAAFTANAQSMPYNPDSEPDGYIGVGDVLQVLSIFGSQFGIDSSLTCDYDGTPIEEFWGNVYNGDILIDSILVQYHTLDSAQVFIAGCPDPVWETVSYERAWTTTSSYTSSTTMLWTVYYGSFLREFTLTYSSSNGYFEFRIRDLEVSELNLDEVLGSNISNPLSGQGLGEPSGWYLPFPTDAASMDENGVHFENWNGFLSGATYVNILPYWHYAD